MRTAANTRTIKRYVTCGRARRSFGHGSVFDCRVRSVCKLVFLLLKNACRDRSAPVILRDGRQWWARAKSTVLQLGPGPFDLPAVVVSDSELARRNRIARENAGYWTRAVR